MTDTMTFAQYHRTFLSDLDDMVSQGILTAETAQAMSTAVRPLVRAMASMDERNQLKAFDEWTEVIQQVIDVLREEQVIH